MTGESSGTSRKDLVQGFAALFLVVGILAVIGWAVLRGLEHLQSGVAAAVVTASATILISVFSLIFSKRWEQKRAIEQANREQKLPVYEEFIRFWFHASFNADSDEAPTEEDFKRFVAEFSQKLALWASDDVLRAYNRFREIGLAAAADEKGAEADPALLLAFEQLMFTIRKDLGHANKGLTAGDLLRLYINDVDDFLPRS